jgi:subtilisin family serine protease
MEGRAFVWPSFFGSPVPICRGWRVFMRQTHLLLAPMFALLSACGGDGGSSTGSVAQPLSVTPAPLAPPQVGNNFDTAELRYNGGLAAIKPIAAYDKGATGKGVVLGILDTGINPDNPEFIGRLAAGSADFLDGGPVKDRDGHGTIVSSVIAAAKNEKDGHGVAYEATLFAGRILNSYDPEVGRSQAQIQADNVAFYNAFANGVDAARAAGARSINLSIGFGEAKVSDPGAPPPPRGPLDDAFERTVTALERAQRGGVIYVVSAGNESAQRPNGFARLLLPSNGATVPVLIVGAVDANNQIASFSNQAGTGTDAKYFLVAPGVRVLARDNEGAQFSYSGTSLAAPFVNGALGLLFQAFPNLTGQQAVDLLLRSATDLGAPGFDAVYGNGLLNIENAFRPQGQQSLALGSATVALPINAPLGTIGGAFGSGAALRGALSSLTFLDGYDRAFSGNFSAALQNRRAVVGLQSHAIARQNVAVSNVQAGGASLQFSGVRTNSWQRAAHDLRERDTRLTDVRLQVQSPLTGTLSFTAATGVTAQELLGSDAQNTMLLLDDVRLNQSTTVRPDVSFGLLKHGKIWRSSVAFSHSTLDTKMSTTRLDLQAARAYGAHDLRFGLALATERGHVLGSESRILFGEAAGSQSLSTLLGWRWQSGPLSLGAQAQLGRTSLALGSNALANGSSALLTSSFSAQARYDVNRNMQMHFAVAQPLRVESGSANLRLPTSYDYAARQSRFTTLAAGLAPDARELDLELGFVGSVGPFEHVQLNAYHRLNPGHRADTTNDSGVLLRWQSAF